MKNKGVIKFLTVRGHKFIVNNRVIIAIKIRQVYQYGGVNFSGGGGHNFLDFDDA